MSQQTPGQARVIDPILSGYARGYRQRSLIASALFPNATVAIYGGQIIEFGKESFRLYSSKRAPGATTKRIEFGYEGKPYAIVPSALEATVPRELMRDASRVPGIELGSRAVSTVLRSLLLEHEKACADIATNAANYDAGHKVTLAGASSWTNPASKPIEDVLAAREAIRSTVGVYPNTLMIPATIWSALKTNKSLVERANTSALQVVTLDMLKNLFEVRNIAVGEAVIADAGKTFGDVWGKSCVLAYVPENGADSGSTDAGNAEEPSYGYTYVIEGMPLVEQPYYDNGAKSWVYGVSYDNTPVLSGMEAGFLIQSVGDGA
jgi:hypothetical protein